MAEKPRNYSSWIMLQLLVLLHLSMSVKVWNVDRAKTEQLDYIKELVQRALAGDESPHNATGDSVKESRRYDNVIRFNQLYRGIEVFGYEVIQRFGTDYGGKFLSGLNDALGDVDAAGFDPKTQEAEVLNATKAEYAAKDGIDPSAYTSSSTDESKTMVFAGLHASKDPRVAYYYQFDLFSDQSMHRPVVIVDAADGTILLEYDNLQTGGGGIADGAKGVGPL